MSSKTHQKILVNLLSVVLIFSQLSLSLPQTVFANQQPDYTKPYKDLADEVARHINGNSKVSLDVRVDGRVHLNQLIYRDTTSIVLDDFFSRTADSEPRIMLISYIISLLSVIGMGQTVFKTAETELTPAILASLLLAFIVALPVALSVSIPVRASLRYKKEKLVKKKLETVFWNRLEENGVKVSKQFRHIWLDNVYSGKFLHSKEYESTKAFISELERLRSCAVQMMCISPSETIQRTLQSFVEELPSIDTKRIKPELLIEFLRSKETFHYFINLDGFSAPEIQEIYQQYQLGSQHALTADLDTLLPDINSTTKSALQLLDYKIHGTDFLSFVKNLKEQEALKINLHIDFISKVPVSPKLPVGIATLKVTLVVTEKVQGSESDLRIAGVYVAERDFSVKSDFKNIVHVGQEEYQPGLVDALDELVLTVREKMQGVDVGAHTCTRFMDHPVREDGPVFNQKKVSE